MVVEGSVSLKRGGKEVSIAPPLNEDPATPKHNAAIKLQKVYKSFRTRRKLADCALVEQSWWKLLDFAELKHGSISFFDIEHHETAISRWSRAKTRAVKVGKGLSKNDKAQKLALQHWLEAIDPRYRYGHNLHFYYVKWLESHSKEPFFYWLDIGEGKEVNVDKCPRSKLQQLRGWPTKCVWRMGSFSTNRVESPLSDPSLLVPENAKLLAWVGDEILPRENAKVSVFDSIVQGGDSVWEGLRVYNGKIFKLEEHLDSWTIIASKFKDKTTRQCRRRWYTYLNSDFKKGGWSPEEDILLCEMKFEDWKKVNRLRCSSTIYD